jgi:surface antigen
MKNLLMGLFLIVCLSGCLSDYDSNGNFQHKRQKVGTIAGIASGAALGSYIGSGAGFNGSLFGAAFGGLFGGVLGNRAGAYLDARAQQKMNQAGFYALNHGANGSVYNWAEGNSSGSFIPSSSFQNNGLYCREYYQKVNIGGNVQNAYGTACRMPDGSWRIMN